LPSTESMTGNFPSAEFPNRFQRESLNLINSMFKLSSSAFYLVDPDMRHRGVVLRNLEPEVERDYASNFRHIDPLNPALFARTDDRVVCIDEQMSERKLLQSDYYLEFMLPNNHRHVADMFFRRESDIIAVLTMLRSELEGVFTVDELTQLRKLQPFLEYTLNSVYLPKRIQQRRGAQERFGLTDREVDVLELIVAGANNKEIARELGLSLATVKTHIQHIFHKAEVSSRTALSARVLVDTPG
jgi:DNA-binding CsgD family transcriptional regulator